MSKRSETVTAEDLYCDETPCSEKADGPCALCPQDLCRKHGDIGMTLQHIGILICGPHRSAPISELLDDPERVPRRQDEFTMTRAAAIAAPIAKPES